MDCLNCGKRFTKSENYCSVCGQDTHTRRLETKHVVHSFIHSFTHTDKSFFYLIPQLLVKPGIVAREYNLGRRKKYFNPFTFVILLIAITTVVVSNFRLMTPDLEEKFDPIKDFLNKHVNVVIFLSIPIMAYFTSLLFKKKGLNFAEAMVLGCYTSGERSIFYTLVVSPIIILYRGYFHTILYVYLLLFVLYYAWACCQYFNDYKLSTFAKGLLSFILCQIIITVLITIAYTIYYSYH